MSHFVIVANGAAGPSVPEEGRLISGLLAESATVSLRWTDPDDDLGALVEELSPDVVVIAGGDGSVHHVINSLPQKPSDRCRSGSSPGHRQRLRPGHGHPIGGDRGRRGASHR